MIGLKPSVARRWQAPLDRERSLQCMFCVCCWGSIVLESMQRVDVGRLVTNKSCSKSHVALCHVILCCCWMYFVPTWARGSLVFVVCVAWVATVCSWYCNRWTTPLGARLCVVHSPAPRVVGLGVVCLCFLLLLGGASSAPPRARLCILSYPYNLFPRSACI